MSLSSIFSFEANIDGQWQPIRIVRSIKPREAIDGLPTFAKQQKVDIDRARARPLRTEDDLQDAENAVIDYNRKHLQ